MVDQVATPQQGAAKPMTEGTAPIQVSTKAITDLTETAVKSIKDLADVADKSASSLLLALGATIAVLTPVAEFVVLNVPLAKALPSEDFIAVQAVAIAALAGGAAMRVYAFKRGEDAAAATSRTTAEGISKIVEIHRAERAAELDAATPKVPGNGQPQPAPKSGGM